MRPVTIAMSLVLFAQVNSQFLKFPREIMDSFPWLRQGRNRHEKIETSLPPSTVLISRSTIADKTTFSATQFPETTRTAPVSRPNTIAQTVVGGSSSGGTTIKVSSSLPKRPIKIKSTTPSVITLSQQTIAKAADRNSVWTTVALTTQSPTTKRKESSSTTGTMGTMDTTTVTQTEASTLLETTSQEVTGTTDEPRDNHRLHDFYISKREKPQVKINSNISQNLLPLPAGAGAALVKPTKYHYYPHNQHIYLLPECAIQQVCNAVYVRLNWTQPLCACPSRYRDPCSASLNSDDQHTTELLTDPKRRRALTLVKTCEPIAEMRICRTPRDWSLLALQNIRTGKSHYLVICRCPDSSILEGPMSHDQPTYASVPGIRVYGMMCVQAGIKRWGRPLRLARATEHLSFPWDRVTEFSKTALWE